MPATLENKAAPVAYFEFDKLAFGSAAGNEFWIDLDWSGFCMRGTFDALQLYKNGKLHHIKVKCKMNKIPDDSIVVTDIASKIIKVVISGDSCIEKINKIGFVCHADYFSVQILDEQNKINKIKELISVSALFSFGYGWYPSEVVAYYKERGIDFGIYKVIRWAGKDEYTIEDIE